MYGRFGELNLYVYNAARGAVFDVVIWCLGPVVDDSRSYGYFRSLLAALTIRVCRLIIRAER